MCDSLCLLGRGGSGSIFAKNSDRPFSELQLLRSHPPRKASGSDELRTQYLTIPDLGAFATVLSQADWLWGAEHGINSHHVAIGNEKVNGIADPFKAPPALIGMDLVRLGLERARTATEAVDVITELLDRHGQGGIADAAHNEPYWSSFLIVDPHSAWILETSGQSWAAKSVDTEAAISNRIAISADWTRASDDVNNGDAFDRWRDPETNTGHADKRLEASNAFLKNASVENRSAQAAAHLRDHGTGPWGSPTDPASRQRISELPQTLEADGTGVTICMHVRGYVSTTASLICELPEDPDEPAKAFAALGSPCASIYLPFIVPGPSFVGAAPIPEALSVPETANRFSSIRGSVEGKVGALELVRAGFGPLEAELWEQAPPLANDVFAWERFCASASERIDDALDTAARLDLS
ncbi:MAG: C69 family dipeptidase [Acidimicrobiales bacterium]